MKITDTQIEKLLSMRSAQEIKNRLMLRKMVPSLAQAGKLQRHLSLLEAERQRLRLGIVHTYTSELLDPWLHFSAALNRCDLDIYHAPYGLGLQEAAANSGLARHSPDITLLLLAREDLHPEFTTPFACIKPADRQELSKQFQRAIDGVVRRFRDSIAGHIIVTLLPGALSPGLGLFDGMAENSEALWWSQVKSGLAACLREQFSGVSFLDLDQLLMQVGRDNFFDPRLWYSSAFPFAPEGAFAVSNAVSTVAATLHQTRAKVIVLDADNTLWGGVIGEDGLSGIALGKDYPGRAYVDFQKRLLGFQQRGFILALCSKNNPEDLNEVLQHHPHQVLKSEHFAAQRVNWLPKVDNLKSIARELNLGLDSFVFVDDSDHECSAVRHGLPEVEVVQVPSQAVELPACLDTLARLEITSLTSEDLEKTRMYAQERLRKSQLEDITQTGASINEYLQSLGMEMTVGLDELKLLPRLAQLTQKTNQFNLTTRRYSEQDIARMIADDNFSVYHFSLKDSFGDSGIVGLGIVERESDKRARLDTFLMSCRVIGRQAEQAFLHRILVDLRSSGVAELSGEYIPTRKNVLVESFLTDNEFVPTGDGSYLRNLQMDTQDPGADFPIAIKGPFKQ